MSQSVQTVKDGKYTPQFNNSLYDFVMKLVVIGDTGVGKTALVARCADNAFEESHQTTIGVDFKFWNVTTDAGKTVKVQLWDTAGQQRYRTVAPYYKGTDAVAICFDLTNRASFFMCEMWLNEIRRNSNENAPIVLIGTKLDACGDGKRQVLKPDALQFAKKHHLLYFETSSKTGDKVADCFKTLVETWLKTASEVPPKEIVYQKPGLPTKNTTTVIPDSPTKPKTKPCVFGNIFGGCRYVKV